MPEESKGAKREGSEEGTGETKPSGDLAESADGQVAPTNGKAEAALVLAVIEGGVSKEGPSPDPSGVLFTLGHPTAVWGISEFLTVLARHKVKTVLDARSAADTGPAPEAVRVSCSASGIAYERQPILSRVYVKLVNQARGRAGEAARPLVLLSAIVSWRFQQTRRCIGQVMKAKGLEVQHLTWAGDVDPEARVLCEKQPNRADFKYPKAPPPGPRSKAPPVMRARPKDTAPTKPETEPVFQAKPKPPPSSDAAPKEPTMMPSKPKEPPTSKSAGEGPDATVLQARPKGVPEEPKAALLAKRQMAPKKAAAPTPAAAAATPSVEKVTVTMPSQVAKQIPAPKVPGKQTPAPKVSVTMPAQAAKQTPAPKAAPKVSEPTGPPEQKEPPPVLRASAKAPAKAASSDGGPAKKPRL